MSTGCVNALSLDLGVASKCSLVGEGEFADRAWTKEDFRLICQHMLNGNSDCDFMLVYRDNAGEPCFVKAKRAKVERRVNWAWQTITGRSRSKVGIGFYPSNCDRRSRWGALDFDAHDGNAERAHGLALAALRVVVRQPELYIVVGTSGSQGRHLFVFVEDFYPIEDWTRFLKQVVSCIGVEVRSGCCEIFPNESSAPAWPYGIRAPGTWNPKTDELGLIIFNSLGPLLKRQAEKKKEAEKERKKSPFLYHSTTTAEPSQLNDTAGVSFYAGGRLSWLKQFAIVAPSTRHAQLKGLVHAIFRQVGHRIGLKNAEAQYKLAGPRPNASLAGHLEEFEELWSWTDTEWRGELSAIEQDCFAHFGSEVECDLFRILRNFSHYADSQGASDFPFPIEHAALRIGVSTQHISKLRQRFIEIGILVQTKPAITNRSAARFRWCLPNSARTSGEKSTPSAIGATARINDSSV